ncbi:unnamed protein product [Prunus armeniaca]
MHRRHQSRQWRSLLVPGSVTAPQHDRHHFDLAAGAPESQPVEDGKDYSGDERHRATPTVDQHS